MVQRLSRAVREGLVYGVLLVSPSAYALAATPPSGVAQLSSPETLVPQAQIALPPLEQGDVYGPMRLSADGSTLLISAVGEDCSAGPSCGAVYVLTQRFGTWTQEARLVAADPSAIDLFGNSVALTSEGGTVLVGAWQQDCAKGPECGAVYVFTRGADGAWSGSQKLLPSQIEAFDYFGASVAISGDGATALIGAFGASCANGIPGCGTVYVFVRSGASWIEAGEIPAPIGFFKESFGSNIALSRDGQTALILANVFGLAPSSVFAFRRSGGNWILEAQIDAPIPATFYWVE